MNKKIVIIILLIILVIIGGTYFLFDAVSNNSSILGVSHFNNTDISFDYPGIWIEDNNTNYNLTFRSFFYVMNLNIFNKLYVFVL